MVLTDFLVFGAILLFGLWALMRGFVSSFLWISGWVAAGFATIYGLPFVEPFARDLIPGETVAKATAAVTIFIVTLIIVSVISNQISSAVRSSSLGALDRSLGFLFGGAIGASVVCLGYILLSWLSNDPAKHPAWVLNAQTLPAIQRGANFLRSMVPGDTRTAGKETVDRAKDQTQRMIDASRTMQDLANQLNAVQSPPAAMAPRATGPQASGPNAPSSPAPSSPAPSSSAPSSSAPPLAAPVSGQVSATPIPPATSPTGAKTAPPGLGDSQQQLDQLIQKIQQ